MYVVSKQKSTGMETERRTVTVAAGHTTAFLSFRDAGPGRRYSIAISLEELEQMARDVRLQQHKSLRARIDYLEAKCLD